jgi:hypothetical protein
MKNTKHVYELHFYKYICGVNDDKIEDICKVLFLNKEDAIEKAYTLVCKRNKILKNKIKKVSNNSWDNEFDSDYYETFYYLNIKRINLN